MGPLEDAIREHLELMRRRGADPAQIARLEADALSPVVREVEQPEAHEDDQGLIAGTEAVPAVEIEPFEDEVGDELPFDGEEPLDFDSVEAVETGSVDQPTRHFETIAEDEVEEELEAEAEDEADAEAEVALEEQDWEDPSLRGREASLEADEDGAEEDLPDNESEETVESEGSEDVLEGTPDFLAETPDHDKLWFEQSGPRDFDFDDDSAK
ncbi:MAG: hypothetical protein NT122_06370 [Solirubrobacterales bacterium]|nr:hypothetical protein [Solirubrobacterales bacterium]